MYRRSKLNQGIPRSNDFHIHKVQQQNKTRQQEQEYSHRLQSNISKPKLELKGHETQQKGKQTRDSASLHTIYTG